MVIRPDAGPGFDLEDLTQVSQERVDTDAPNAPSVLQVLQPCGELPALPPIAAPDLQQERVVLCHTPLPTRVRLPGVFGPSLGPGSPDLLQL